MRSSHILVYNSSAQAFTLERVENGVNLNLTSSPWQLDGDELKRQYPQLGHEIAEDSNAEEDDLFSDGDVSTTEDSNPYDYRRWIQGQRPSVFEARQESKPRLAAPTHTIHRKEVPKTKAKAKPKLAPKDDVPKQDIRDDYADDESSDDGGLVIEMGSKSVVGKSTAHTLHPERFVSAGPISLRSAASSASPAARRWSDNDSNQQSSDSESGGEESREERRLAENGKEEVEVRLPSPVTGADDPGEDEDDDELEAELAQALNSEDVLPEKVESESESEEE